jgi:septal ring factor EnvC (AmiA/AmiB activator)
MADDNGETKPDDTPAPKETVKEVHVGLTQEQLDHQIHKLREELASTSVEDKREKEELRAEIAELKAHKEKLEAAEEAREKTKSSETTMVVPPSDIPPQQPNVDRDNATETQGGKKPKMRWW